jgi:hypothetical protein
MPARRMYALITGLPDDAAVWRADKRGWSQQDELLATQTELLDQLGRRFVYWLQVIAAPSYRGLTARVPDGLLHPIEHPGRHGGAAPAPARRRRMTTAEMKHFFGGRR